MVPTREQSDYLEKPKNRILLFLFLIYVVYWYLQVGYRIPFLGAIRFEFIFGLFLSVSSILVIMKNGMPRSSVLVWMLAFLFVTLISVITSSDVALSWTIFVDRVVKFAMIGVFVFAFVATPSALRWFMAFYLLSFFKMAQEGIFGIVSGSLIWENQGTPRLHGATPNYNHPNSFAGTQLGTVPFAVYLFGATKSRLRYILPVQVAMALVIVIYSGSRTAYVAIGAMFLGFFLLSQTRSRVFLTLSALILASVPVIPDEYWERFDTIRTQQDEEGRSIALRREILSDSWAIFVSNPFGVGVGAFPVVRREEFGRSQDTHNLYLQVATNIGIQGLIVFFGLLIAMVRSLRKSLKQIRWVIGSIRGSPKFGTSQLYQDAMLVQAAVKAVLCFLIIRFALGMFGHDLYEVYWWFAAGMAMSLEKITAGLLAKSGAPDDLD